jgi:Type II secretion system (T2SS), protein G
MKPAARRWLVIVGVFLLGALCGLSVPPMIIHHSVMAQHDRHMKITADIHALGVELDRFKSANGVYPSALQQLGSVAAARQDPWGNAYVYRYPGKQDPKGYDLFSPGPDHTAGSLDDDWGEP